MEKRENFSKKRMAILHTLRGTDTHPTAEWIYTRLRPQYPDLSLGTVYRNLKRFCEKGQIVSVGVINSQEHFDGCTEPHAHFVCTQCGAVLDVPEQHFPSRELDRLSENTGWQVQSASLTFRGVCCRCQEKAQ